MVPERFGHALAAAAGASAYRRLDHVRARVTANQARVLGLDPDDARVQRSTRDAFRLYARFWYDTFHLPAVSPERLKARVDVRGVHHVNAALAAGRGCLVVTPHLGNTDVSGRWLAIHGYRVATVIENLRPARLATLFRRHRERLGMRVVLLIDPKAVREEVERLLADNWIVALVADRSLSRRGIEVEMFGARRAIPAGPALLARATGAALVVAAGYMAPSGWRIVFGPTLAPQRSGDARADVTALAHRLAAEFESAIAVQPADWHVFERAWPDVARAPQGRSVFARRGVSSSALGPS
jgi:phosphatidylinositol dimannoside acyltransferase